MSRLPFDNFFHTATGNSPYGYQCRLACGEQYGRTEAEWLVSGTTYQSQQLLNIPTGFGETVANIVPSHATAELSQAL